MSINSEGGPMKDFNFFSKLTNFGPRIKIKKDEEWLSIFVNKLLPMKCEAIKNNFLRI